MLLCDNGRRWQRENAQHGGLLDVNFRAHFVQQSHAGRSRTAPFRRRLVNQGTQVPAPRQFRILTNKTNRNIVQHFRVLMYSNTVQYKRPQPVLIHERFVRGANLCAPRKVWMRRRMSRLVVMPTKAPLRTTSTYLCVCVCVCVCACV